MFIKAFRLLIYFSFTVITVRAQNLSKSPYSALGIGDLQFGGNATQSALGQTVQGFRRASEINNQNPASYGGLKYTIIEAGFKQSSGDIINTFGSSRIYNYSYGYLSIGIPLSQKLRWGLSFGLQPVSSVGYSVASNVTYADATGSMNLPAILQTAGKGGISKFYLGTGIAVLKNLSVGVNVSYMWGQLSTIKSIYIDPSLNQYNVQEVRKTYVGDVYVDYGIQYHKLFKNKLLEDKYKLVIGTTFNLATGLNSSQDYSARTLGVGGISGTKDTIVYDGNRKGVINLPFIIKSGVSFEEIDKWMVCADINYANWSTYKLFGTTDSLKNNLSISAGASFIPKKADYKNYINRIEYRVGARYDNGYLNIYGTNISTYGVSAGLGLPLSIRGSKLNITGEYFVRGTAKDNLIREEYFRIIMGLTFSDKWFVRYKYD